MASFEALPRELQLIIITEYLRPAPPEPNASRFARFFCVRPEPRPTLDVDLALQLAIISPSCRNIVSSLLLRHVRITRPSALRQLCSTLRRRPEVALLINSIHLGSMGSGEAFHWPFYAPREEEAWPFVKLRSSLATREQTLLPHWCQSGFSARIPANNQNCVYAAVDRALEEAVKGLDIEPTRRGYSRSGINIGLREWVERCFLLVAAFDLYLIQMRRLDDLLKYRISRWNGWGPPPEACAKSTCGHTYPRYQVYFEGCKLPSTGQDVSAAGSGETGWTFTVKEAQLWEQLERPGGPGDDFDHLTLFTNSTRAGLGMSDKELQRVRAALRGPCPQKFTNIDWLKRMGYDPYDELEELSAHSDHSEEEEEDKWPHVSSSASEDYDIGRATRNGRSDRAEDLLIMARRLLYLATEVENLSLTGIFFRALSALQARSLRALTIGPHPHFWAEVLPFEAVARLPSLVKLRVVGKMSKEDASRIAYELPRLEHFEWEMIELKAPLQRVYDNVCALQGHRNLADTYAGRGESPRRKRIRYSLESNSANDGSPASSPTRSTTSETSKADASAAHSPPTPQRRTLVLLRRENVRELCSMTPFEEVRDSWQGDGRRLEHNLHGLKIERSEAADAEVAKGGHNSREVAALYAAGRRWWQEGNSGEGVFEREGV